MRAGDECGISLRRFNDAKAGDVVEVFEAVERVREIFGGGEVLQVFPIARGGLGMWRGCTPGVLKGVVRAGATGCSTSRAVKTLNEAVWTKEGYAREGIEVVWRSGRFRQLRRAV